MTGSGEQKAVFSAAIPVSLSPTDEEVRVAMSRREWQRITRLANGIRPSMQWFSIAASVAMGTAVACAVNWVIAYTDANAAFTTKFYNGGAAVMFFTVGLVCFIAQKRENESSMRDINHLKTELKEFEDSNTILKG